MVGIHFFLDYGLSELRLGGTWFILMFLVTILKGGPIDGDIR
jgi:hypothetical protein